MAAGHVIPAAGRSVDLTPVHDAIESHQDHFSLLLQRIWDEAQERIDGGLQERPGDRVLVEALKYIRQAATDPLWRPSYVRASIESPLHMALWLGQEAFDRGLDD